MHATSTQVPSETAAGRSPTTASNIRVPMFNRLPYDIIGEIATYALPREPSASRSQSPLSLCQVSSSWRTAVLASSYLWSTLHIRADLELPVLHDREIQIKEFFARAGATRGLTLFLRCDEDLDDETGPIFAKFLEGLSQIISQTRRLGLWSTTPHILFAHLVDMPWDLSRLEVLDLICRWEDDHIDDPGSLPVVSLFLQAPKLRQILIDFEFIGSAVEKELLLPWQNITTFNLHDPGFSLSNWIKIMDLCPQLRVGDFTIGDDWVQDSIKSYPPQPRVHPHLQSLAMVMIDQGEISILDIIAIFKLPALRDLDIANNLGGEEYTSSAPLYNNFDNLRSLYVDAADGGLSIECLTEILHRTSTLEKLTLIFTSDSFLPLFDAMSYSQSAIILPHLTFLRVDVLPEARVTELQPHWISLVDMIKSRSLGNMPSHCQRLKRVSIAGSPMANPMFGPYYPVVEEVGRRLLPCHHARVDLVFHECSETDWRASRVSIFEN